MNMLLNNGLQQLDEAGLYSPIGGVQPHSTQDAIDAGVKEARVLRARAFHDAVWTLMALLNGSNRTAG